MGERDDDSDAENIDDLEQANIFISLSGRDDLSGKNLSSRIYGGN